MTLPSIPDNSYKVLLFLGLVLLGFFGYHLYTSTYNYNGKVSISNSQIDSLTVKEMHIKHEKTILVDIANDLSKKHKITNPISENDTMTFFVKRLRGTEVELLVSDSLERIWARLKNGYFELQLLDKKIEMAQTDLKTLYKDYKSENFGLLGIAFLGTVLGIIGYIGMAKYQNLHERLILAEISQKVARFRFCQSCGQRFSSIKLRGRNESGETNEAFCIDCYDEGKFKEPDLTLNEFQKRAKGVIASVKGKGARKDLQRRFDNLDRWKTNRYY